MAKVPTLLFRNCDNESLTLEWNGEGNVDYKLEFRDIGHGSWESASAIRIPPTEDGKQVAVISDLLPSMTYIVRLLVIDKEGNVQGTGPDIAFDTQVISCIPDGPARCCGCTIS